MTGISFPSLVRVSPGLVFLPVSQDRALLRGATRKYVIEGTIAVDILRNATQPISAAELISRGMIAGGEVEVLETLSSLIRRGYIVEAVDQVSSQFTQFDAIWTGLGVNSADA